VESKADFSNKTAFLYLSNSDMMNKNKQFAILVIQLSNVPALLLQQDQKV